MDSLSALPTHIYVLCEPGTEVATGDTPPADRVRYVGKTTDAKSRYYEHCKAYTHYHVSRWVRGLKANAQLPVMVIIEVVTPPADWAERERYWIAWYGAAGARLTNHTAGGEHGGIIDPEVRGRWLAAIRAARSTPESRARTSAASKAVMERPGVRERAGALLRQMNQSEEYRQLRRQQTTERMRNPAARAKRIEGLAKLVADPERLAERGEAISRGRRANPAGQKESRDRFVTDEFRESGMAANRAAWADPEKRAARILAIRAGLAAYHDRKRAERAKAEQP